MRVLGRFVLAAGAGISVLLFGVLAAMVFRWVRRARAHGRERPWIPDAGICRHWCPHLRLLLLAGCCFEPERVEANCHRTKGSFS